jgi:hypothetical protein
MPNQLTGSTMTLTSVGQLWSAPHRLILTIMWLVTTVTIITMLLLNVSDTGRYSEVCYILQASYVAALIWYLIRSATSTSQLPKIRPLVFPHWRYSTWLPVLIIITVFLLSAISDGDQGILLLMMIIATWWILLAWHRQVKIHSVIQGFALALIVYLAGLPMLNNDSISEIAFYGLLINVPPMYIAGGLLVQRTHLGGVQLLGKRNRQALRSFFWGCLLFVPLGLINAVVVSTGPDMTWVSEWWIPFTLPWFSAIAEETWFRLLLVGLCYFTLRPAFPRRPAVPIFISVLISAASFGLGHGGTYLERLLVTGLLYGLPMAVVFAKRDWEHAVGAHYMINMIPTLIVFLKS